MSLDDAKKFMASVVVDKDIIDQLVGYAGERGFEFSAIELQRYLAREMSEEELESVSGGADGTFDPRILLESLGVAKKKKPAKK